MELDLLGGLSVCLSVMSSMSRVCQVVVRVTWSLTCSVSLRVTQMKALTVTLTTPVFNAAPSPPLLLALMQVCLSVMFLYSRPWCSGVAGLQVVCLSVCDVGALWINAYKNRVGFWREGCYRGPLVRCGSSAAHGNGDLVRDGLLDLDIVWLSLCHGRQYQQLLICRL